MSHLIWHYWGRPSGSDSENAPLDPSKGRFFFFRFNGTSWEFQGVCNPTIALSVR